MQSSVTGHVSERVFLFVIISKKGKAEMQRGRGTQRKAGESYSPVPRYMLLGCPPTAKKDTGTLPKLPHYVLARQGDKCLTQHLKWPSIAVVDITNS